MPELTKYALIAGSLFLMACDSNDLTRDRGFDSKDLSELKAGIWVDPNGCHHWIIDDGIEGYMSQRLDRFGKPVCLDSAPGGIAEGDFKGGSAVGDQLF